MAQAILRLEPPFQARATHRVGAHLSHMRITCLMCKLPTSSRRYFRLLKAYGMFHTFKSK
ncbi:hypothetical protein TorRG33x02_315500, partial [Trema orientale]